MRRSLRLAIAWALLIAFLCLTPGKALPQWEWADLLSIDKFVHVLMFGILSYLLARGLRDREVRVWPDGKVLLVAGMLAFVYGGLMELLQELPGLGRRGDVVDLTANTIGAVAGAFLVSRYWARQRAEA